MIIFEFIDPVHFPIALLIVLGAYFIFGISGFGSSITAVPMLVQLYPLKTVIPVMVIIDICASSYVGRQSSKEACLDELKWALPFSLMGMVLGAIMLIKLPSKPLLITLGLFAFMNGCRVLWRRHHELIKPINKYWAFPFGFIGGMFTALFATGGPIYATYLGLRIGDLRALRATMAFAILMLALLRLVFMLVTGLILNWSVIGLAICLIPVTFLGLWLGTHAHGKMSNSSLRITFGVILLFSGAMLLIRQFY